MSTQCKPDTHEEVDFVPLCVPEIRGNEWRYMRECLDTGWVSSVGSYVDRFEEGISKYVGAKYAIATVNGTAALHTALLVAGIRPQDEVIVPTLTFIAPVNAIRYTGAWPVFVDVEPVYWQMDAEKLIYFIEKGCFWKNDGLYNRVTGRQIKAILPVHILGHPVDMNPILEIARKYNLIVIEDATESIGAKYNNRMVGHLGDIGCFSFNGNKLITTGGGGMLVTDREEWAQRARYLTTQAKDDPVEFVHHEIGYNYRLTNIQAAVGCAQLEVLDEYICAKRNISLRYKEGLRNIPGLESMREARWASSVFWMYTVLVNKLKYGLDHLELMRNLRERSIDSRPLWQPIHLSPAHKGSFATDCSVAEVVQRKALSLPCSVGLTSTQHEFVIENLLSLGVGFKKSH
ncbi:MAG: putative pyridoxal phosphate-dependent aminotransferase EpsN [Syntrophorhabdus sp. PtaU1.Bin002]|nr:MAG: putative pyridoxal phosphate-dependent aminotransferase EpsN [Syntrophorhabdus sp. PtaU1.Bin002]